MNEDPHFDARLLAQLARLQLSDAELAEFSAQLGHVLAYVAKLDEVNTENVEPTAHANPVLAMLREDAPRPGFGVENALRNAPRRAQDQFVVPKVVE